MKNNYFKSLVFTICVIFLILHSVEVTCGLPGPIVQNERYWFAIDEYIVNRTDVGYLNFTIDVGVPYTIYSVCNFSTFRLEDKTGLMYFTHWYFTPNRGMMAWTNYTSPYMGNANYNNRDWDDTPDPRQLAFYIPGVYKFVSNGYCLERAGSFPNITGYITVRGYNNPDPLTLQNDVDSPAVYNTSDYASTYVQWRSPTSGFGIRSSSKLQNPFDVPIQVGYLNTMTVYQTSYWQYENDLPFIYLDNSNLTLLDGSTLDGSSSPVQPVTTYQPGELKYTIPFNSMPIAEIANCTTFKYPDLPIIKYSQFNSGFLSLMIKLDIPNAMWVPIAVAEWTTFFTAKYNQQTYQYEIVSKTLQSIPIPYSDAKFLLPQWNHLSTDTEALYYFTRNLTAPYCWDYIDNEN